MTPAQEVSATGATIGTSSAKDHVIAVAPVKTPRRPRKTNIEARESARRSMSPGAAGPSPRRKDHRPRAHESQFNDVDAAGNSPGAGGQLVNVQTDHLRSAAGASTIASTTGATIKPPSDKDHHDVVAPVKTPRRPRKTMLRMRESAMVTMSAGAAGKSRRRKDQCVPARESQSPGIDAAGSSPGAGGLSAHVHTDHRRSAAGASVIDLIREHYRDRQILVRAQTALTNQLKAFGRFLCAGDKKAGAALLVAVERGDTSDPRAAMLAVRALALLTARQQLTAERERLDALLRQHAATLPAAAFASAVRGFALGSLAAIIGEAGDLANYATVAKLNKRMGLAVFHGKSQRRSRTDAETQGFSPARRAVMWVIGDCLVKQNREGVYRQLYDARKVYELARGVTKLHAHRRAKRYAEKRLLKDLWRFWRSHREVNSQ